MIGAALVAFAAFPVYLILGGRSIGIAGRDIAGSADRAYEILLLGTFIVIVLAVLASRFVRSETVDGWVAAAARLLRRPPRLAFAFGAGTIAFLITALFAVFVLDGKPNLIDAMAQLLHARFIAEGALAGPTSPSTQWWHLQNSVVTPGGWVSHYPPGFPVLLAVGHLAGAPWLVGALLAGAAIFFTSLAAEHLLPERTAEVRLGVLLAAQSPFIIGLAGAQMNHVAAAAFIALAVYAAVRGIPGGIGWALLSGASLGAAFTVRPLAALVAAATVILIVAHAHGSGGWRATAMRVAGGFVGAAPFGLATVWYNDRFFGSPFRFGYEYAFGPAVGLGFRVDPWGNSYGVIEAIGFTSTDLTMLGQSLLESPLSAVIVVGLYLLIARRLEFGERVIAAWALLPVAANFFYWHHGIFMGPRMLNEVAPAWCVLLALSAPGIVRSLPREMNLGGYYARTAAAFAFIIGLGAGALYLAPERLLSYRTFMASSRIPPPVAPDSSLVFVHGAWTSRIVMRLAAAGMSLDSIETAIRQNPTCLVDHFSRGYPGQRTPELDFVRDGARELPMVSVRGEYTIRLGREPLSPECRRELEADRLGTLDVSPMLWQVRVPGLTTGGALVVRDMGPETNAELIAAYPTLTPLMYHRSSPEEPASLSPYDDAVGRIWQE